MTFSIARYKKINCQVRFMKEKDRNHADFMLNMKERKHFSGWKRIVSYFLGIRKMERKNKKHISKLGDKSLVDYGECKSKQLNHVLVVSVLDFLLCCSTICCLYLSAVKVIFIFRCSEARKSLNRPPARKVLDNLIYNYSPTYCGKAGYADIMLLRLLFMQQIWMEVSSTGSFSLNAGRDSMRSTSLHSLNFEFEGVAHGLHVHYCWQKLKMVYCWKCILFFTILLL